MMRRVCAIFVLGVSLVMQAACTPIGDGALKVRGQVVAPELEPYRACLLDTRDGSGVVVERQNVSGKFASTVIIEPRTADYSFAISCQGADETYQSPTFRVGATDRYENPIDLGRVVLKRP